MKSTSVVGKFIRSIDECDIEFQDNALLKNDDKGFKGLIAEYEKIVVSSLITSFGLDFLMFDDRTGGDIQTVNNARNGVFSEDKYKKRFNESYDRKKYEDTSKMNAYKKDKFKNNEKVYSGYTNKELKKDGSTHTEHIYSAAEYHRDDRARLFQSDEERKNIINDDNNFTLIESNINQSKSDQSMDEFLNKKVKGQDETNDKRFDIDKEEAMKKYDESKRYVDKKVMQSQMRHYSSELLKKGSLSAAKMGLRQGLGIILTELWMIIREEFPKVIRKLKKNFSFDELLKSISNVVKRAFEKIKGKYKDILASIKEGAIAGFLSVVSSTIMNIFFTTAKSVGKILRTSWGSIVEAVKILVLNPEGLGNGDKIKAVSKILATSISVICGSLVQEGISKIMPTIPVLVDILPMFLGTMVTGIMSVSFLYFIDNSAMVQKLVNFLNDIKSSEDITLENFESINIALKDYASKIARIDLKELDRQIESIKDINLHLERAENIESFNKVLYGALDKYKIKLEFSDSSEFDSFMRNKESVLII